MAKQTATTTGNVVDDIPKPSQPETKWATIEEAKSFDKFLNKNFVPKNDEKFSKKFFVRPISIIPYTPAGALSSTQQTLYKFLVQKYHRNKMRAVGVSDGKGGRETIQDNEPVEGHRMVEAGRHGEGTWECVDDMASFTIDARDFKENYQSDKVED